MQPDEKDHIEQQSSHHADHVVARRPATGLVTVAETGPARNDVISVVGGLLFYVVFLVWLHPLLIGTSPLP